jgi:hypothetical protein
MTRPRRIPHCHLTVRSSGLPSVAAELKRFSVDTKGAENQWTRVPHEEASVRFGGYRTMRGPVDVSTVTALVEPW